MATRRKLVEKITARVFCSLDGNGGNPVTIFAATSDQSLSTRTRQKLAQECIWESVMVDQVNRLMDFYLPTGQAVAFCAHAAMGGATVLQGSTIQSSSTATTGNEDLTSKSVIQFQSAMNDDVQFSATLDRDGKDPVVSLEMNSIAWTQTPVSHPPTLHRLLRDCFGLRSTIDLVQPKQVQSVPFPHFCNATVLGRPKTLVYVNTLEAIHNVTLPSTRQADNFAKACDAIDASTGIYLYSPKVEPSNHTPSTITDDMERIYSWECRQFPRASGYPEDPATGIAAASLAIGLVSRQRYLRQQLERQSGWSHETPLVNSYFFHQGTSMGQPSFIQVNNIQFHDSKLNKHSFTPDDDGTTNVAVVVAGDDHVEDDGNEKGDIEEKPVVPIEQNEIVSFCLVGHVQVDNREWLEIEDE